MCPRWQDCQLKRSIRRTAADFPMGLTSSCVRCLGFCGQSNSLFCKEEEGRSHGTGKAAAKGTHTAFVLRGVQAGGGAIAPGWAFSVVGGGAARPYGTECPVQLEESYPASRGAGWANLGR